MLEDGSHATDTVLQLYHPNWKLLPWAFLEFTVYRVDSRGLGGFGWVGWFRWVGWFQVVSGGFGAILGGFGWVGWFRVVPPFSINENVVTEVLHF